MDGRQRVTRVGRWSWMRMTVASLLAVAPGLSAQTGPAVVADRAGRAVTSDQALHARAVESPPEIDGRLDEPAWAEADFADGFVQQVPDAGSRASERSAVRILVDDEAVYIGARLLDAAADDVVARLGRRDDPVQADWFYVYLDSYHDRRTAFVFGVSAAGVQRDLRIAEDSREDAGWDAVWASAVTGDADGWTVEMEIPLSQLRFNAEPDARWGLNFRRDIARRNEVAYWAEIPRGTDRFVSIFGELRGLDGVEPGRRLEVLPYTVGRLVREPRVAGDPFHEATDGHGTVGADVRIGLGSSLTLSATINPDFGQVEADPATVNLTAFETFLQERRPFFVEGSDIFTLSFPFWPPFFYSRRIGRSPQGFAPPEAVYQESPAATTILGALKLSGKTSSGWSVGLLNALTGQERLRFADAEGDREAVVVEPRTSYSVARVFRELREGRSGVGTMVTATHRRLDGTEMDFLHRSSYAFGTDAFHRFRDEEYVVNLSVLGSHVRGTERALLRTQRAAGHYFQRPDAQHVELDSSRISLTGLSVAGQIQRVRGRVKWGAWGQATTPGYEINDLGFNPTLDEQAANVWLRYEDFTPGRVFQNWSLGTMGGLQRGWGGELRELTADLGFFFQLRNQWGGGVWAMRHAPAWSATALRGGPAIRKPGRWMGSFSVNSDRRRRLSGNAFLFWTVEDEAGGYTVQSSADITVRPSDRLELRLGPSWSAAFDSWQFVRRIEEAEGSPYLVGGLDRRTVSLSTRLSYAFSPSLSLQLYARPFLASGDYRGLREVTDPRAADFDARFRTYSADESTLSGGSYRIDRDGDGEIDITVGDPSFNVANLQMNTVLRWEYRPGSTLFAVWTHDRSRSGREAWALGSGLDRLASTPARNVFQLKLSYWMGL